MKHISDFILERRELLKDKFHLITLDEFIKYVDAAYDYDEDSEDFKKVKDIITTTLGENTYEKFETYITSMAWKIRKNEYEKTYDNLLNTPSLRLPKIIGVGGYGTVFKIGNGLIVKRAHDLEKGFGPMEFKYYNFLLKQNKCPYLPKIYKLTEHLVVMEELILNVKKIRDFVNILMFTDFTEDVPKLVYPRFAHTPLDRIVAGDVRTGKDTLKEKGISDRTIREAYEWCKEIHKALLSAGLENKIDLDFKNVGARKDGTIVFFDAIADM